jgi:hypothetical protein
VVRAGQFVSSHRGAIQGETQVRARVLYREDAPARPDHQHRRQIGLNRDHGAAAAEGVVDWPEIEYACSLASCYGSSHDDAFACRAAKAVGSTETG